MKYVRKLCHGETGFSLIELLVVIAIMGSLAVIAGVNAGKYIGHGKTQAYATELHDIRTVLSAMIHDSSAGMLDSAQSNITDMDLVTADSGAEVLSNYLKNLDSNGNVLTGCTYTFTINGTVTQASTP